MATFFTADSHFGHQAIIDYCSRPFATVSEMNEAMFDLWASTVGPKDEVYHLGDVAFRNVEGVVKRLKGLKGKKNLVPGNHDRKSLTKLAECFKVLPPLYETAFRPGAGCTKVRAVLCHYPLAAWNASFHSSIMLYGHVHGRMPGNRQSVDVGADSWNFCPIRLEDLLQWMETLPAYVPLDAGCE
jgi:Predicted phosphoesterase or phosphohydrolase